jgi:hypothetical protein
MSDNAFPLPERQRRSTGAGGVLRRFGAVLTVAALSGTGLLVLAGPAAAASCDDVKDVVVRSNLLKVGEAHYTVTCLDGWLRVNGRVQDTRKDGRCIETKIMIGSALKKAAACGAGTSTDFDMVGTVHGFRHGRDSRRRGERLHLPTLSESPGEGDSTKVTGPRSGMVGPSPPPRPASPPTVPTSAVLNVA